MQSIYLFSVITIIICQGLLTVAVEEACNEYVDKIIDDLKQDKEYMQDPYTIPEKSVEVHKKVLLVNYTGEAKIYDGYIYGLSSLHRQEDVVVDRNGKKTVLKVWLAAGVLQMKCSGKVKLMGHGPSLTVNAKIDLVTMKLDVTPTNGSNPKITNFHLEDVKGAEVKVSGLGPLKFFLKQYVKIINLMFKNLIKHQLEGKMKEFLDKRVKKYEIPEECLNGNYRRSLVF